jgi:hypothetical protein
MIGTLTLVIERVGLEGAGLSGAAVKKPTKLTKNNTCKFQNETKLISLIDFGTIMKISQHLSYLTVGLPS